MAGLCIDVGGGCPFIIIISTTMDLRVPILIPTSLGIVTPIVENKLLVFDFYKAEIPPIYPPVLELGLPVGGKFA